jgi:NDP-sugar pyrophosphorylase family protein
MHVLIPAGGQGTRLRPLTNDQPKPLLPLGDRPILSRIVEALPESCPVTVIVTGEFESLFEAWQRKWHPEGRVRILSESPVESGPGGPVAALADCIQRLGLDEDLLITMGDSVLPMCFKQFSRGGTKARIAAYRLPNRQDAARFGVVQFGDDSVLTDFEEKPAKPASNWIFTGCCYLPTRLARRIAAIAGEVAPQMGNLIAELLRQGEQVEVQPVRGEWHDIGTFQSYLQAHGSYMSKDQSQRLRAQGNQLDGVVYVHPSATIRSSVLRNCVVLEHTSITDACLTDCVVQPHISIRSRIIERKLVAAGGELPFSAGGIA